MKHAQYPAPRTLFIIWLALILATAITMMAGKVTQIASIGVVWTAVLMIVTGLKANLILSYFLDLRSATGGWNKAFNALIIIIIIAIFALYAGGSLAVIKV